MSYPNKEFWKDKRVFITGHNGFKGTWLTLWLASLGSKVFGYSLNPPSKPNLYEIVNAKEDCQEFFGDVTNFDELLESFEKFQPQIVFHLAAQPLVKKSYENPLGTLKINVMGTANVLEAARQVTSVKVFISVTGGLADTLAKEGTNVKKYSPYNVSKRCLELITESYQKSFFESFSKNSAIVEPLRVIGGGDFTKSRLIPDIVSSLQEKKQFIPRNKDILYSWGDHVLEPLRGYLLLVEKLWEDSSYCERWSFFGKEKKTDIQSFIDFLYKAWDDKATELEFLNKDFRENLEATKEKLRLGWECVFSKVASLKFTLKWYKNYLQGSNMREFTISQLKEYEEYVKKYEEMERGRLN